MIRYYDQPTVQCDSCTYHVRDAYPNGTPYWACRAYGYILHEDKPVTDEPCDRYVNSEAQAQEEARRRQARSMRDLGRLNRKK